MSYYLIIRGPLGAGKTSISQRLAQELNAKHMPIDSVLEEYDLTHDHEDGYISQRSFKKANDILVPQAIKLLESGTPVIFDGKFYWQSQLENLMMRLPFPHEVFTLNVSLNTCITRDSERPTPHGKEATEIVYKKTVAFSCGILIDGSDTINVTVSAIKDKLPQ